MSPRLGFLLGGVQKAGTTALAAALASHPGVALPAGKEAHVFDAPDFDDGEDSAGVDRRFRAAFPEESWADGSLRLGDATPITVFRPKLVARVARYNPAMRWIILLREPVDRAISQWHMERARGNERLPLWASFLAEPWRLRGHEDDFSDGSPLRHHSYLARGRYRAQCTALFRHFPREQVLLLRTEWLANAPEATLRAVWAHLALPAPAPTTIPRAFEGGYERVSSWHPARWIARLALLKDDPWRYVEQECPHA
jgi:hypothetical protein